MKIKLDENLPDLAAAELRNLGHDVDTVADEGLCGSQDEVLWRAIQVAQRFLITQDLDFSDARKYPAGSHSGILRASARRFEDGRDRRPRKRNLRKRAGRSVAKLLRRSDGVEGSGYETPTSLTKFVITVAQPSP